MDEPSEPPAHVLFVASSGGHLAHLLWLRPWWDGLRRTWVTFDKPDARSLLVDEDVRWAFHPTTRNLKNLVRNLVLAVRLVPRLRPDVVVSTGAGVAVPFAWITRLHGGRVVYIESVTRIDSISLSCRLIRPVAERTYVQWPETVPLVRGARHVGNLFSDGESA